MQASITFIQAPNRKFQCAPRTPRTILHLRIANEKNNGEKKTRRMERNAARKKSRESNDINKTINKIHFVKIDFSIICTLRFSVACSTDDCATHSLVSRVFSKSSPVFWSSFKIGFFSFFASSFHGMSGIRKFIHNFQ